MKRFILLLLALALALAVAFATDSAKDRNSGDSPKVLARN